MSIKPVAMIPEDEMQCLIDGHTAIVIPVGDALPDEVCTLLYAIPDTHRVVPVKPTPEMINAALPHAMRESDEDKYRAMGMIICIWDEMLAAHAATASQTEKCAGTGSVYAIPDTHRVVPASALAGVLHLAGYAVPYTDHGSDLRADFGTISDALQAVPK